MGTTCLVKMAVKVSLSARIACSFSSGILAKASLVGAKTVMPSVGEHDHYTNKEKLKFIFGLTS